MNHLIIDTDKCVGCKKCASACLKDNIKIINKKAVEQNTGCIECSHCVSVCPKGAIQLKNDDDNTKKSKWFDGGLISDEEFATLFDAAVHTAVRPEDKIDLISLKGERLNSFMELIWSIVKDKASTTPIVKEWEEWRKEHNVMEPNPILWESQQVLFIFAKEQENAMLASMKIQRRGFSMGISGFYSVIIMEASRESPEKIAEFFNEISRERKMQCAFVIGHGRRLIEPAFAPLNAIKKLFR